MTLQTLKRNEKRLEGVGDERGAEKEMSSDKNGERTNGMGNHLNHQIPSSGSGSGSGVMTSNLRDSSLDHEREEENELFEAIKAMESNLLFLLHRNNIDDIIVYLPPSPTSSSSSSSSVSEMISLYRLRDPSDPQTIEDISSFEKMMAYGPKPIPNSNRSEPDVIEIPCPGIGNGDGTQVGEFIGCLQLPIASAVLIEIWKYSPPCSDLSDSSATPSLPKYWATVTANQIAYAVLECLYIKSEVRWGFTTVTSVEITARHPVDGHLLVEEIPVG